MTETPKLYLLGASCSGVSTLGAALSQRLAVPQIDVDGVYWMPTDPPFTTKRPPEDRVRLIRARQAETAAWILTGSFMGWGDGLIGDVDLIVFLATATEVRLARLDRRERERHGPRILPGGDMHAAHLAFRDWAARYDDPDFPQRSRAQHEAWLARQEAPVLRLDGAQAVDVLAGAVMEALRRG